MGFKEAFKKWSEKKKQEKEEFRRMQRDLRLRKLLEERQKPAAQREYEFYQKEKDKENLTKMLKKERKERAEKMKRLSSPFNKRASIIGGGNEMMRGGINWI